MAKITLSRNLKLKISSDLSADSKYNLDRIDLLAGNLLPQSVGDITLRSAGAITLEPNSADLNGSGVGGAINLGSADKPLDSLNIFSSAINFSASGISLKDSADGGTRSLILSYLSEGPDTAADRTLSIDPQGANRSLVLGTDLSILGPGALEWVVPADLALTLPSSVGAPGQVLTTDGTGLLSWESATAASLDGLTDVVISSPAQGDSLRFNSSSQKWENGQTGFSTSWTNAHGASRVCTHNLGTRNIAVHIYDSAYQKIEIDSIESTTDTYATLAASEAPDSLDPWTVLIYPI